MSTSDIPLTKGGDMVPDIIKRDMREKTRSEVEETSEGVTLR